MKNILVFCGKKQAGKSSSAKCAVGLMLKNAGIVEGYGLNENGDLLVPVEEKMGVLDVYRSDQEFVEWAIFNMFPHVQIFSFATELKEAVIRIFGIDRELVYGTNEQKNVLTDVKWIDVKKLLRGLPNYSDFKNKKGKLTVRELLQVFGTEVCRTVLDSCWIDRTFDKIKQSTAELCIIDDCRFENEFIEAKKREALLVLCKKDEEDDASHSSEQFEFPEDEVDMVLNKSQLTLEEKGAAIKGFLLDKQIIGVQL